MSSHLRLLKEDLYHKYATLDEPDDVGEVDVGGAISTFFDLKKVFDVNDEGIGEMHELMVAHRDLFSINFQNKIVITAQSKFETLNSCFFPRDFYMDSELFFVVGFTISLTDSFKDSDKYQIK